MQITLNFHPDLRNLFPDSITLEAVSPIAALRLIAEQHPLNGKVDPVPVKFEEIASFEELNRNYFESMSVNIVPTEAATVVNSPSSYSGAGKGFLNIIVGVVFIVAAFFVPPLLNLSPLLTNMAAGALLNIGMTLTLTGLMQLLAPKPDEPDNKKSAYFSNNNSTTSADTPIQLAFGRRRIFGHYISLNMDSRNYSGDMDKDSGWFKGKVNENLPNIRLERFYGFIKSADTIIVKQVNNSTDNTGTQT